MASWPLAARTPEILPVIPARFTLYALAATCALATTVGAAEANAQVVREAQLGTLRVTAPVGYHLGVASDQGLIGVFPDSVKGGPPPGKNRQGFELGGHMFTRLQERCAAGVHCGSWRTYSTTSAEHGPRST